MGIMSERAMDAAMGRWEESVGLWDNGGFMPLPSVPSVSAPLEVYYIVNWNTREIMAEVASLSIAKRVARNYGHDGTDNGEGRFAPIAFVGIFVDGVMCCEYNPIFKVGRDDNARRC